MQKSQLLGKYLVESNYSPKTTSQMINNLSVYLVKNKYILKCYKLRYINKIMLFFEFPGCVSVCMSQFRNAPFNNKSTSALMKSSFQILPAEFFYLFISNHELVSFFLELADYEHFITLPTTCTETFEMCISDMLMSTWNVHVQTF